MRDWNYHRKIGHAGVMAVKKELTIRGWNLAEPDVDCGVDLIAWGDGSAFIRIQVKTCTQGFKTQHGAKFLISRVKHNKKSRHGYSNKDCDFLVCHCLSNHGFWVVPINEAAGRLKFSVMADDEFHNRWDYMDSYYPEDVQFRATSGGLVKTSAEIAAKKMSEIKILKKEITNLKGRANKMMRIIASERNYSNQVKEQMDEQRDQFKNCNRDSYLMYQFIRENQQVREYRDWRPVYRRNQEILDQMSREALKKVKFNFHLA